MFNMIADFFRNLFVLVGMVGTKSSFPPPLSREDETKMIMRMKDGDPVARDKLIEHNLRLVAHIARKYSAKGRDMDDLISIGTIGLVKAIGTFSDEKGKTIAAYAAKCVENEILMSIRSERKRKGEVSLMDPIGTDRDGNEITLADIIPSNDDVISEQVEKREAGITVRRAVCDVLTPRERKVIEMRYGLRDGNLMPQREVGKALQISRSYVSRIEKKALCKLNHYLGDE